MSLLLLFSGSVAVQAPLNTFDMQRPRELVAAITWRSHIQATDLNLLRPGINPFAQYDWPVPKSASRLPYLISHIEPTDLGNLRPEVNPFRQTDWSGVPRAAARSRDLATHIKSTDLPILRPDVPPFRQTDWPKPAGVALKPDAQPPNLLGTTLVPVAAQDPFKQTDWLVPKAPPRAIDLTTNVDPTDLLNLRPEVQPFSQKDWPKPSGSARKPDELPPNLLGTTLAPVAAQAPFSPSWPAPQRAPTALRGEVRGTDLVTLRPDVVPFRNLEWKVPLGRDFPISLRAWTISLNETTLVPSVAQAPFGQTNWPNKPLITLNLRDTPLGTPLVLTVQPSVVVVPPGGGGKKKRRVEWDPQTGRRMKPPRVAKAEPEHTPALEMRPPLLDAAMNEEIVKRLDAAASEQLRAAIEADDEAVILAILAES